MVEHRIVVPGVVGSSPISHPIFGGPLAQLVEQLTLNQWVEGSNPSGPTTFLVCMMFQEHGQSGITARVAELADALDLGSSGKPWGFESPLSHHSSKELGV